MDDNAIAGKRVLITGGRGLVGREICRQVADRGGIPRSFDNNSAYPLSVYEAIESIEGYDVLDIERITGDIRDAASINRAMQGVDICIHAAALADVAACTDAPGDAVDNNIKGTSNVIAAAKHYDVGRFVFVSSASVYGAGHEGQLVFSEADPIEPYSVYANTKAWGESEVRHQFQGTGIAWSIVRYFSVYGEPQVPKPGSHSWASACFALAARNKGRIDLHNGGVQVRDFTHVDDIAEGTLRVATAESAVGSILNMGTGVRTSVADMAELYLKAEPALEIKKTARKPGDPLGAAADTTQLSSRLEWVPEVRVEAGVRRHDMWMRQLLRSAPDVERLITP